MYVVLEYLAYLVGILVFAGLLFGATVLVMITRSGAEQLTKATRYVATQARVMAADVVHARMFRHKLSSRPAQSDS